MKRTLAIASLVAFATIAAPASAQDAGARVQDAIIAQLTTQGFTRIQVSNTLLGRVRLLATAPGVSREIILNPRTGEILRDYWDADDEIDDGPVSPLVGNGLATTPGGKAPGAGGGDRDDAGGNGAAAQDDDDRDDDDDADDDDSDDDDDDADDDDGDDGGDDDDDDDDAEGDDD